MNPYNGIPYTALCILRREYKEMIKMYKEMGNDSDAEFFEYHLGLVEVFF